MVIQIVLSLMRRVWIKSLLIILVCGLSLAAMRFVAALGYRTPEPLAALGLFSVQLLLVLTLLVTYHTTEFSPSVGFPTRMYVLPARTSLLVLAQMLAGTMAGVLVYSAVAAIAWIALGARWPLLGPSLFLAVFLAWNMTIMWFAPGLSIAKAVPAMLIWGALLVWVGRRYGIDGVPIDPTQAWAHVTLGELLTLALLGAGAYAVALAGVSRDRRGDSPELRRFKEWLEQEVVGHAHRDRDFSGPAAAQIWFEMHTKGHLIPTANAFIQLAIVIVFLCGRRDGMDAVTLIAATLVVPAGCPYFVGLLAGSCGRPDEPGRMDSFRAIRPMSSTALAHAMLKNAGLSLLLTWAGWLASILLLVVCAGITGRFAEFIAALAGFCEKVGVGRLALICFAAIVLSWTAMALAASGAMGDKRWIRWIPRGAVVAMSLALLYFHAQGMIAPAQYLTLFKVFCWAAGSTCLATTVRAFYQARRKQLITARTIRLATSAWVVLCLTAGYALWRLHGAMRVDARFPPELIPAYSAAFLLAGLLTLPFAPLATAPLNLARSRSH